MHRDREREREFGVPFQTINKINSIEVIPKRKRRSYKILEENTGVCPHVLGIGNGLLHVTPKAQVTNICHLTRDRDRCRYQ